MEQESGSGQDAKKCCHRGHGAIKVIAAMVLILLGWIAGFLMGQGGLCGKGKGMCPMSSMMCPMGGGNPEAPAKK